MSISAVYQSDSVTHIPEYTYIAPDMTDVHVKWGDCLFTASVFVDQLILDEDLKEGSDSKILATYEDDYYKGYGALSINKIGKGEVYYYGSAFNEEAVKVFFDKLGVSNPFGKYLDLPKELELAVRENNNGKYAFILNYEKGEKTFRIKEKAFDLISEETISGDITLPGYGAIVLKL